jgi:RNA polymerase sigma-70 factor (ECF subfamily)
VKTGKDGVSQADLIARARRGDGAAWELMVRDHQQAIFRLAYLLLGDPDDAEDVAQETLIRAYRALDRFDASRPLRPWLLRITTNLARNQRRSAGRYLAALQRLVRADPDLITNTRGENLHAALRARGPAQEDAQTLWQAVRRLSQADQEIIYLRYFLDLSESETARVLEIAPGTVKSRMHRALNRLRTLVEKEFPTLRESLEE